MFLSFLSINDPALYKNKGRMAFQKNMGIYKFFSLIFFLFHDIVKPEETIHSKRLNHRAPCVRRIGKKRKQPENETSKLIPTVDSSSDDQIFNEQNGIFLCLFKLVNKLYFFNSHPFIWCSFVRYAYEEDLPTSSWVYMGCLYTMWNAQTCWWLQWWRWCSTSLYSSG